MEKQLKKQRNKIFLRIALILFAVWLAVSASYCAFCLYLAKTDIQKNELANLSYAKSTLSTGQANIDHLTSTLIYSSNILFFDTDILTDLDSQLLVVDRTSQEVIENTAGKINVRYGVRSSEEVSYDEYGLLDYNTVRNALTDEQFNEICSYLNTSRNDGKKFELICTKFQLEYFDIIPLELKLVVNSGEGTWFISDEIIKTYSLEQNYIEGEEIFNCNEMRRNTVPKDFLVNGLYTRDFISTLPKDQLNDAVATISTGAFQYIFYATDYFYINRMNYNKERAIPDSDLDEYAANGKLYVVHYAKYINLPEICKNKLIFGTSVIFLFFFTIALILCLMIWKMVKSQIIQEKKRADLTNALAHDIKTPLFVISGYAYSLKEDIDSTERENYIDKIIDQTDSINDMVHKMLNLSKLDSYMIKLSRSDFDLYELVKGLTDRYAKLPDGKSLELSHNGNNTVNADRELIKTAVQNLTDNAVKYSLPESVIKIDIDGKRLTISNLSEPLTKGEIKQIWQPYVRKDKSRSKNGNGLGLSIVKSIFDLHGIKYGMNMKDDAVICYAEF